MSLPSFDRNQSSDNKYRLINLPSSNRRNVAQTTNVPNLGRYLDKHEEA